MYSAGAGFDAGRQRPALHPKARNPNPILLPPLPVVCEVRRPTPAGNPEDLEGGGGARAMSMQQGRPAKLAFHSLILCGRKTQ